MFIIRWHLLVKKMRPENLCIELLDALLFYFGDFRLEDKHYDYEGVELEIVFIMQDLFISMKVYWLRIYLSNQGNF